MTNCNKCGYLGNNNYCHYYKEDLVKTKKIACHGFTLAREKRRRFNGIDIAVFILILISTITMFGVYIPFLISEKSDLSATFGMFLIGMYVTYMFIYVRTIIRKWGKK